MDKEKTKSVAMAKTNFILIFSALAFVIPFILTPNQLVNGTLVNAALFLSAILVPNNFFLPIILLPSLATLSRGLIFGTFTPFLAYFIPFIWLSNILLVYTFKKTKLFGFTTGVIVSSSLKYLFLLTASSIFFRLNLVPKIFLSLMGNLQLITSLAGGITALVIAKIALNEKN